MRYPIVLIDVDDTIFDFCVAERNALHDVLKKLDINWKEMYLERYHIINEGYWKKVEQGIYTREEIGPLRFQDFAKEFHLTFNYVQADELFYEYLGQQIEWMPYAKETIKMLSHSYSIYLATNGKTSTQQNRIKLSELDKWSKGIYVSEGIGYSKPNKEFFSKIMEDLKDMDPDHYVMIGDSLSSDIQGGINSNIKTIWYNPKKQKNKKMNADYEIHSFQQLPPLLNELSGNCK